MLTPMYPLTLKLPPVFTMLFVFTNKPYEPLPDCKIKFLFGALLKTKSPAFALPEYAPPVEA